MENIIIFFQVKKVLGNPESNKNIQQEYKNGILHGKMSYAENEKWEKRNKGRNRTTTFRKLQNSWREGQLQELGNIRADGIKHR